MNKKNLKILATLLIFVYYFFLLFLYEKIPNFLTSIVSPTNDSLLEYSKVLFGSILLSGVTQKAIIAIANEKINNTCLSNFIGAIASIPIFLLMYLPYRYFGGASMIIPIIITFITFIISEYISYIIMNKRDFKMEKKTIFLAIAVYIIFMMLTYSPLK